MALIKPMPWWPGLRRYDAIPVPVGRWPMWNGTGSEATELVAGNVGLIDGPEWIATDRGFALDFIKANTDEFHIDKAVTPNYPFSVSIWFRPRTLSGSTTAIWSMSDGAVETKQYYIIVRTNGEIGVGLRNTSFTSADAPLGTAVVGEWVHIVGRWHNDSLRDVFINGKFSAQGTTFVAAFTPTKTDFGILGDSSVNFWCDGAISDVSHFDSILESSEIVDLFNKPNRLITPKSRTYSTAAPAGPAFFPYHVRQERRELLAR